MRIGLMAVALLALGGCGKPPADTVALNEAPVENLAANETVPDNAQIEALALGNLAEPEPAVMLGKVDLAQDVMGFGTEPFWSLNIHGTDIHYTDSSLETPVSEPFTGVKRVLTKGKAVYIASNSRGTPIELTLTAKPCLEVGEPEDTVPLTVELKIGGLVLHGCAGSAAMVEKLQK
jgi:uncharacterized membrane protein